MKTKDQILTEQFYQWDGKHSAAGYTSYIPAAMEEYVMEVIKEDRLLRLAREHFNIMRNENILIQVYCNASGFLWMLTKTDSGTDLGWSEFNGNCKYSGTFLSYLDALEDAITLIEKCDLEKFQKETAAGKFHWGNYATHLNNNYRS
jgi:hypothetical protein